jgi:hypothetical protein
LCFALEGRHGVLRLQTCGARVEVDLEQFFSEWRRRCTSVPALRFPSLGSEAFAAWILATSAPYSSLRSNSVRTCSSCAVFRFSSTVMANPPAALTSDSTSASAAARGDPAGRI